MNTHFEHTYKRYVLLINGSTIGPYTNTWKEAIACWEAYRKEMDMSRVKEANIHEIIFTQTVENIWELVP